MNRREFLQKGALVASGMVLMPGEALGTMFNSASSQNSKLAHLAIRNDDDLLYVPPHIVMEAETGRILSSHNANLVRQPASFIKILHAMVVFDAIDAGKIDWEDEFYISPDVTRAVEKQERSAPRFLNRKKISVREAMYAQIIKSMNEPSIGLARLLGGGSEEKFIELMQHKADAIGAYNTRVKNVMGYYNSAQATTLEDVALISRHLVYAYANHYPMFSMKKAVIGDGQELETSNVFLKNYPGADGIKTEYIRKTGHGVTASAERDGKRVVAATTKFRTTRYQKGQERAAEYMMRLMDNIGFERHSKPAEGLDSPLSIEEKEKALGEISKRTRNLFKDELPAPVVQPRGIVELTVN